VGLFGSRWEPAVVPLQILAVFGVIRAFSGTTGPVLQAAGRPQLVLLLNVWHLAVLCAALFTLTQPFGLKGAAWAVVIAAAASLVPAFRFALRILDLPLRELLANVERPAVCSVPLLLGLLAVLASTHALSDWLQLLALVVCGVAVYSASTLAFARGELRAITAAFRSS
jgi:O-antigen/teichoic acid export membrane protein